MKTRVLLGAAFVFAGGTLMLRAQVPFGEPGSDPAETPSGAFASVPDTFGTASYTKVTLSSWGFTPLGDGQWNHFVGTGWSNRSGGTNNAMCTDVHLPTGALLSGISTYTNDTDATFNVTYTLFENLLSAGTQGTSFSFATSGTPGVERAMRVVDPVVTINNNENAYVLCIQHGSPSNTNQSAGATLWYKLQVSPAPGVATFSDVPTSHPFFRFVEALVSAGITGGCGSGLYCPNSPVTRGQMAVFLSVALGLHFPN